MTQSQTQNQNLTEGLNRIRRWRDQYRSMQPPSPLEDVNQLAAKLEMTPCPIPPASPSCSLPAMSGWIRVPRHGCA